mgnify:CR=1 FL=1
MARNISFFLTKRQFLDRSKDVTRRLGWGWAKPGDVLCGIEKGQGLKKGERIVRLGDIRLVSVRQEPLQRMLDDLKYGRDEVRREGFPEMTPAEFVAFFCASHSGCFPDRPLTRLEFAYI